MITITMSGPYIETDTVSIKPSADIAYAVRNMVIDALGELACSCAGPDGYHDYCDSCRAIDEATETADDQGSGEVMTEAAGRIAWTITID